MPTQPGQAAQAAIAVIMDSVLTCADDEDGRRTNEQSGEYLKAITETLRELDDLERVLLIAYLGDISRTLNTALADHRGVPSDEHLQGIALAIARSTIDE